ncbi:hypothetical protein H5410_023144 [Solanum commersonii]|uniref:tRNAHis guanylyltransferase catalytic domain-containing protein n=1 Tax=Solanum commersonii TaxID=4109 RepID=A0A9J5ZII9_SOLCO|nr:hypothetical protein H5410_023144 [Solanum commersonii]
MASNRYEYVKWFEVKDEVMYPNIIVVQIDGRDFGCFSEKHGFEKSNDDKVLNLMNVCANKRHLGMANNKYEYVKCFEVDDEVMYPNIIVVQIDGRDFGSFSEKHGFEKPNDDKALNLINDCAFKTVIPFFFPLEKLDSVIQRFMQFCFEEGNHSLPEASKLVFSGKSEKEAKEILKVL